MRLLGKFFWTFLGYTVCCQCFKNVTEWLAWSPDLRITRMFLNSTCGALLNATLDAMPDRNVTLFVPTDKAWYDTFNLTDFQGFANLSCPTHYDGATIMDCYAMLSRNLSTVSLTNASHCLPLLSLYHTSMYRFDNLTDRGNVTVIPTALDIRGLAFQLPPFGTNSTRSMASHTAAFNVTQVIVANTTGDPTVLGGGAASNATIVNTYPADDGRLYLIDSILSMPLPLNSTILALNLTTGPVDGGNHTLNGTGIHGINNTEITTFSLRRNITVFYPVEGLNEPFDLACQVSPGIFYLNSTTPLSHNLTTFAGKSLLIEYGGTNSSSAPLINHNISIVQANIPINNGVLHLINGTIGAYNVSNTQGAQALHTNMNMWLRWLRE